MQYYIINLIVLYVLYMFLYSYLLYIVGYEPDTLLL